MRGNRRRRGVTLLETIMAAAIGVGVMGTAIGVYVKGTSGYFNEQSRSYMQSRTRATLDRIAYDARGATSFVNFAYVNGVTYTASIGSPGCLILRVPSKDNNGLMYYGPGTTAPNSLVTDTVVYYMNSSDGTLRRTVQPAVSVVTNDANSPRTSNRPSETGVVVGRDVSRFAMTFRDRDGNSVAASAGPRIASIDLKARVLVTGKTASESPTTITGVRLRNMKSGSVPGTALRGGAGVAGAYVKAVFTSTSGAYPVGTVVSTTTSDSAGSFELYGLVEGTYTIVVIPTSGTSASVSGVMVGQETASSPITVNLP